MAEDLSHLTDEALLVCIRRTADLAKINATHRGDDHLQSIALRKMAESFSAEARRRGLTVEASQ